MMISEMRKKNKNYNKNDNKTDNNDNYCNLPKLFFK